MARAKHIEPERFEVQGNKGGSYVALMQTATEGMVHLEVGETCVRSISQDISVVALAAILTWCKDQGFQEIVNRYFGPDHTVSVERDL